MVCSVASVPRAVRAQAVRKREFVVIDSVTGAPIALADVRIETGRAASPSKQLTTDGTGHFVAATADGEQLLIGIRHIGFAPTEIHLAATAADTSFVIALSPTAARLAPTVTQADRTTHQLEVLGFYERRHVGPGTFLDSAAIADKKPYDLMSILRPYLHGCTMIYIDGMRLLALRDVKVQDVIAIEIYKSNLQAPPQFANPIESVSRCGSIVIWRRF
jgi:hypothetical protein